MGRQPQHPACSAGPADHGGSQDSGRVKLANAVPATGGRRRRRRRRHRRSAGAALTAPAFTSIAAEAHPGHGELPSETDIVQPDPLTLTLYPDATHGRDITEDPMLEEFAASLASSRIVAWPSLELQDEAPAVAASSWRMRT